LEIQLDQAEAALESARVALDRAKLVAPFNGVVAEMNLEVGELPAQTSPAVVLLDASAYYVDLLVDENDVVNIQLGQTVSFRVDALPEASITGSIERLLITPTASTNSEVVTYQARVRLNPSTEPIRVGMSTTANITTKDLQDIIVVPNRFIRIDRQTRQAFVTIQNSSAQTEEIAVELGERNNEVSQIVGGLEPGQRIVRLQNASEVLFGNPN
jgi:HlyD family secretion protein